MADVIFKAPVLGLLSVLGLAACGESRSDVGEVALKAARGFIVPRLVLQADQWFAPEPEIFTVKDNGTPTVLQRAPGAYTLQFDRDGQRLTACSFRIQRDRVIAIALKVVNREVRCDFQ
jgi:hypothetical protein